MSSGGDAIDRWCHIIRLTMQMNTGDIDVALQTVPVGLRDRVRTRLQQDDSVLLRASAPSVLSAGGPQDWGDYDPSSGYYWLRLHRYLTESLARRASEVDALDQSTDTILRHLPRPGQPDTFGTRGLVLGHVQSGKTGNFSALIAKAVDAGYRIVIVLSGIHNSLRLQTQRRLERELGRAGTAGGVGEPEPGTHWQWMTDSTAWGDFNPGTIDGHAMLQGGQAVIFVVKKNASRLRRLNDWIGDAVPATVPVLVIDDEGDQASVNTGGNRPSAAREEEDLALDEVVDLAEADLEPGADTASELSPSVINAEIRRLLDRFGQYAFVAYTATPFANVLITPLVTDVDSGEDLYPRDFIINLPAPPRDLYVGAERLFGQESFNGDEPDTDPLGVIREVPVSEIPLVAPKRGRAVVTESLRRAIRDYVLASAAWRHRAARPVPCTMLVHTGMKRSIQNDLESPVATALAELRQEWLYERDAALARFEGIWSDFRRTTASIDASALMRFEEIEGELDSLLRSGIEVRVLNSDHDDQADFDAEPNLSAILIGGNKLSRGVTIEGLLVSYFVRDTPYYDTLLQMGRWFGYRGRYVDLTRLYTTSALAENFHDLATAEEELRRQIARYARENLTPRDLLPRIRTHPRMKITAPNKMRDAVTTDVSFSASLVQAIRLELEPTQRLADNLRVTRELLSGLGAPLLEENRPTWPDVPAETIRQFLLDFTILEQDSMDRDALVMYLDDRVRGNELTRWRIGVATTRRVNPELGTVDLHVHGHPEIPLITRTRLFGTTSSLGVITSPEDERIGLTPQEQRAAEQLALTQRDSYSRAEAYRSVRSPSEGLLLLYPISPASRPPEGSRTRMAVFPSDPDLTPIVTYAISFPRSSRSVKSYLSAKNTWLTNGTSPI